MRVSAAAAHASTYGRVADPCIHAAAPGGEEEAEGMACAEEDGEDECPFLGDDPLVVLVVVGVVEDHVSHKSPGTASLRCSVIIIRRNELSKEYVA